MKAAEAKKIISVILAAMLIISVTAGSTLAWRDFSQHKSNEFIGINFSEQEELPGGFADLTITKKVELLEGANTGNGDTNDKVENAVVDETVSEPGEEQTEEQSEEQTAEENAPGGLPEDEDSADDDAPVTIMEEDPPLSDLPDPGDDEEAAAEDEITEEAPPEEEPFEFPDDTFIFTVTFTRVPDGPVTVIIDGEPQEMEITNGVLVIELKDGQTAVIKELPVGAGYTITETPMEDYVIRSENEKGRIPEDGITAAFTNYYGPDGGDTLDPTEEPGDKPKPPGPPQPPGTPEPPGSPEPESKPYRPVTGDESNIWLWALIICGAAFGLKYIPLKEFKESEERK